MDSAGIYCKRKRLVILMTHERKSLVAYLILIAIYWIRLEYLRARNWILKRKLARIAHSNAEAGEWAKNSIRMADGPADDLTAGTMASLSPAFWVILAAGACAGTVPMLLVSLMPDGIVRILTSFVIYGAFGGISAIWLGRMQRPVYLAVTQDELVCYRVPKTSQKPARADMLFRMSPCLIRITGKKDKEGRNWVIRVKSRTPGATGRLRSLAVDRSWFRELDDVVAALHAAGAEVPPALQYISGTLEGTESPQGD